MDKSPRLSLTLTPAAESEKRFRDFRTELAGDEPESNMMILDTAVGGAMDRLDAHDSTPITWGMAKNGLGYEPE